ncbi:hypothetical protein KUTeg_024359 [Tegillarca granosa]|uniref:Uncharacterized protein n=1 Tax=Tegillarca granosa TaxID=220873 RepID=A0ABQ9DX54_TEGGR|nr:hypothetical protein KUTeg_024359 [Tegillarca granosa]
MKITNVAHVYPDSKQHEKSYVTDDDHNEEIIGQEKVVSSLSLSRDHKDKHSSQPFIHVTTNIDHVKDAPSLSVPEHPESLFVPSIHVCDSRASDVGSATNNTFQPTTSHSGLSPIVAKSAIKLLRSIANMEQSQSQHSRNEFMALIRDTYRELCNQRENEEFEAILENEWKRIAKVVDRFFFLITTLLILISTLAIFLILTIQQ